MQNPYEEAARAKKVEGLIVAIDLAGLDLDQIRAMKDEHWNLLRLAAGQKSSPSETTRAAVIASLEARAAAGQRAEGKDPFAGFTSPRP